MNERHQATILASLCMALAVGVLAMMIVVELLR
jgi:hypothetical protein